MPEGDTVWLSARRLDAALAGQRVLRSQFRVPALAGADLAGSTVLGVTSRGKHILARFGPSEAVGTGVGAGAGSTATSPTGHDTEPPSRPSPASGLWTLHTHFRMDGSWRVFMPGEGWRGGPAHEVRVVIETAQAIAVGYRLPVVDLVLTADESRLVGHLGPDLLGPDWSPDEAVARLRQHSDTQVGVALMDQRLLAGIGNLYKSETLFLAGLNPWTAVGQVKDLPAVVALARRLLLANRDRWEQVTTGVNRRGEQCWVYGRAGQPCRRCATRIMIDEQGPLRQERSTYWCPRCQPG